MKSQAITKIRKAFRLPAHIHFFGHIQIVFALILEGLDSIKPHEVWFLQIRSKPHLEVVWNLRFQSYFYRSVSVQMLWSLLSDFKVSFDLNCDAQWQRQIQSNRSSSEWHAASSRGVRRTTQLSVDRCWYKLSAETIGEAGGTSVQTKLLWSEHATSIYSFWRLDR